MDVVDVLRGSLVTALDHGHTEGRAISRDGDTWICWTWQEIGPKWIALASGDGDSPDAARALADERLVDEVKRHDGHPPPCARLRNPKLDDAAP